MPATQQIYKNFTGYSYTSRSLSADGEECINLFPEAIESGNSKASNDLVLYRVPGLLEIQVAPIVEGAPDPAYGLFGAIRGMFSLANTQNSSSSGQPGEDTAVIVHGRDTDATWYVSKFFYVAVAGALAVGFYILKIGSISKPPAGEYVSFAGNDFQVLVVSDPNGYIFNTTDNSFTAITADGYNGGVTATCVDGYFVVNNPNANTFSVSAFNDGLTWSGLDQESTQDYPDILTAVANYNHYLQLFSARRGEGYYDTGSNSALFARIEGSYQYSGTKAPWSIAFQDNSPFYVGQNESGGGIVYRLTGFVPSRVSNMAMESQIQEYADTRDAFGYPLQIGGHLLYVCNFPSAQLNPLYTIGGTQPQYLGATWVYDVTTSAAVKQSVWYKWLAWNPNTGQYTAHAGRFYMLYNGIHFMGDFSSPTIYKASLDYGTNNGAPVRWLRSAPQISTQQVRNFYRWMQVDMQTGTGLSANIPGSIVTIPGWGAQTFVVPDEGIDPTISMNWSDDGGYSWSGDLEMIVGAIGQFRQQATANRIGYARDFCARVFGSDPNMVCMVNAFLGVEPGTN